MLMVVFDLRWLVTVGCDALLGDQGADVDVVLHMYEGL